MLALALFACDKDSGAEADTAPVYGDDLEMQAEDFTCITDMEKVGRYYVRNLLGQQEAAVAVASSADGGVFPPGTVVQLISFEAMVKRAEGWNPETNDWEFFYLGISGEGTTIDARGGAEVVNSLGGSCYDCHALAEPQWDFICGVDHGCAPLGLDDATVEALQEADPRCD